MAVRISTEQLRARRIVKNTINRLKSGAEYSASHLYRNTMLKLDALGITPKDATNTKNLDRIIGDLKNEVGDFEKLLKDLEKTPTKREIEKDIAERGGFKPTREHPQPTKDDIKEQYKKDVEDYDLHEWIEDNLNYIYEYEEQLGEVIKGTKLTRPDKTTLEKMKNEIEDNREKYRPTKRKFESPLKETITQGNATITNIQLPFK